VENDADDERVSGAHNWQSDFLIFDDGCAFGTAMCYNPSRRGMYAYTCSEAMENSIYFLSHA
jgi:hypothetical protein